jgi:hypothetical protein
LSVSEKLSHVRKVLCSTWWQSILRIRILEFILPLCHWQTRHMAKVIFLIT